MFKYSWKETEKAVFRPRTELESSILEPSFREQIHSCAFGQGSETEAPPARCLETALFRDASSQLWAAKGQDLCISVTRTPHSAPDREALIVIAQCTDS